MGSVAGFLELFNDTDDDFVVDSVDVNLGAVGSTGRWWWGVFVGGSTTALGSLGGK